MVYRHVFLQSGLQTQLQRAEHASHKSDSNFHASIGLRVVGVRRLLLHVHDMLLHLHNARHARSQGSDRPLVVALENDSGVTEPLQIFDGEVCAVLLLVVAFLRDHVSHHVLGRHAADYDALDHFACSSRLSELLIAQFVCSEFELVAPTNAF